jgi:hypothetical protein
MSAIVIDRIVATFLSAPMPINGSPCCQAAIWLPLDRSHLKSVNPDSFGIASFKAIDGPQLEEALHRAFALNAPALVWVPHGDVPSSWDLIMMPKVR